MKTIHHARLAELHGRPLYKPLADADVSQRARESEGDCGLTTDADGVALQSFVNLVGVFFYLAFVGFVVAVVALTLGIA